MNEKEKFEHAAAFCIFSCFALAIFAGFSINKPVGLAVASFVLFLLAYGCQKASKKESETDDKKSGHIDLTGLIVLGIIAFVVGSWAGGISFILWLIGGGE